MVYVDVASIFRNCHTVHPRPPFNRCAQSAAHPAPVTMITYIRLEICSNWVHHWRPCLSASAHGMLSEA